MYLHHNTTEKKFCCSFKIAGISISLKTELPLQVSKRFQPFLLDDNSTSDYEAFFHKVEVLPDFPDQWLQKEIAFDVGKCSSGRYYRRFRDTKHDGQIYAVSLYDWNRKQISVEYLSDGESNLNQSDNCFFHIAWETIMQLEKCMILHACAVDSLYGGILFSGKSGIGKSTQGNLWCKYEQASPVNGDRPILKKEGNIWYAYGTPYAGSSGYHLNVKTPIKAIIMLKQDDHCSIKKLRTNEAFRRIYTEMTLSPWNPDCVETSCTLAESLILEIPVYELTCTPDRKAVELLKYTLQAEDFYDKKQ